MSLPRSMPTASEARAEMRQLLQNWHVDMFCVFALCSAVLPYTLLHINEVNATCIFVSISVVGALRIDTANELEMLITMGIFAAAMVALLLQIIRAETPERTATSLAFAMQCYAGYYSATGVLPIAEKEEKKKERQE